MFEAELDPQRRKMVLGSQIIVAALVAGCLCFLLIVLVALPGGVADWELGSSRPLSLTALIMAGGILAARLVAPGLVTARKLRQLTEREGPEPAWNDLFAVYQSTLLTKTAMLEGAAFFLISMHMVERSPWTLALAVVLLAVLLAHMPTSRRVDQWIERQSLAIKQTRSRP